MITEEIKPYRVRVILASLAIRTSSWKTRKTSVAEFVLQPRYWLNGMWQGSETILVQRRGENEYRVGGFNGMTLEQTAQMVEEYLTRYGVPYFKEEAWEHPFTYHI